LISSFSVIVSDRSCCARFMICPNCGGPARAGGVAERDALHAALELADEETPVIVLTFGLPQRAREPSEHPAEEWSARANRRPVDDVVRRLP
jgi:hypothetical protein